MVLSMALKQNKTLYMEKAELEIEDGYDQIDLASEEKFSKITITIFPSMFESKFSAGSRGFVAYLNGYIAPLKWENSELIDNIVVPSDSILKQITITSVRGTCEFTILAIIAAFSGDIGFELHEYFNKLDSNERYIMKDICYRFEDANFEESKVFGYAEDGVVLLMARTSSKLVEQVYEAYINYNLGIQNEDSRHLILVNAKDLYKDEYAGT